MVAILIRKLTLTSVSGYLTKTQFTQTQRDLQTDFCSLCGFRNHYPKTAMWPKLHPQAMVLNLRAVGAFCREYKQTDALDRKDLNICSEHSLCILKYANKITNFPRFLILNIFLANVQLPFTVLGWIKQSCRKYSKFSIRNMPQTNSENINPRNYLECFHSCLVLAA